jgi:hypothetical protein
MEPGFNELGVISKGLGNPASTAAMGSPGEAQKSHCQEGTRWWI